MHAHVTFCWTWNVFEASLLVVQADTSSRSSFANIAHSWIASNWVQGTGGGMIISDCPNTIVSDTIFANNGALRGENLDTGPILIQQLFKVLLMVTGRQWLRHR